VVGTFAVFVVAISILFRTVFLYYFANAADIYIYDFARRWYSIFMLVIPFWALFSYMLIVMRALGEYKIPCLFIVGTVLVEWGVARILINVLGFLDAFYKLVWINVLVSLVLFFIVFTFFKAKYAVWLQTKVSMKKMLWVSIQFFKSGSTMVLIGLPLAIMILIETKLFIERGMFLMPPLLIGAVLMAPLMAKLLVDKYAEKKGRM